MRAVFLLFLLAVLALMCPVARGQDEEREVAARVQCDGPRVAAIQFAVKEPGIYTLRLPADICGRSA